MNLSLIQMNGPILTRVFVYGTLKPGGFYHERFCGPFRFEAEPAYIGGRLFDFPHLGYPGAIEDAESGIKGVLLRFRHTEKAVLEKLDFLEGYNPDGPPEKNEYYRKLIPVYTDESDSNAREQAWCYFMTNETVANLGGIAIPDGHWKIRNPSS